MAIVRGSERFVKEETERIDGNRKTIRNMAMVGAELVNRFGHDDGERGSRVIAWGHGSDTFALERFGDDDDVWLTVGHNLNHHSTYLLHPQADLQRVPWRHRLVTTDNGYVASLRNELRAVAYGALLGMCHERLGDRDGLGLDFDDTPLAIHRTGPHEYAIGIDDIVYLLAADKLERQGAAREHNDSRLGVTIEDRLVTLLQLVGDGQEIAEVPPIAHLRPKPPAASPNYASNDDDERPGRSEKRRGPNAIDDATAIHARAVYHDLWVDRAAEDWAASSWKGDDMVRGLFPRYSNTDLGIQLVDCLIGVRDPRESGLQLEVVGLRNDAVLLRVGFNMTNGGPTIAPDVHCRIQGNGITSEFGGEQAANAMIRVMQDMKKRFTAGNVPEWDEERLVSYFYHALPWRLRRPPSARDIAWV